MSNYSAVRPEGVLPPPPGQITNFVNPENHDVEAIAMHAVFIAVTTLFVGMRVYVRAVSLRSFGLDDGKAAMTLRVYRLTPFSILRHRLGKTDCYALLQY